MRDRVIVEICRVLTKPSDKKPLANEVAIEILQVCMEAICEVCLEGSCMPECPLMPPEECKFWSLLGGSNGDTRT